MHELTINKQTYYFPQRWDELTAQQLIYICRLTFDKSNLAEVKLKLLLYFTGLKVYYRKQRIMQGIEHYLIGSSKEHAWWISCHDIIFACKGLDFLFKEIKNKKGEYICHDLDSRLVTNLLPSIELPHSFLFMALSGVKLHGPASGLTNLIFEEYIQAETNLVRFRETGKQEYLHKFIAILYRPVKSKREQQSITYDGDIRLRFNDSAIDSRARQIEKLAPEIKKAILLWYDGCKYFITKQFPNLFKPPTEEETSEPGDTFRNFMKLVDNMADSDVTKKPTIRQSYLMDVLESLEQTSIKAQKQKEELERMRAR